MTGLSSVLILLARRAAVMACLLPFRSDGAETAFVARMGLRGAVPMYLTIIPCSRGTKVGQILFNVVFLVVLVPGDPKLDHRPPLGCFA